MDRRTFLAGAGAVLLAAPLAAEAQSMGKVWRIGILGTSDGPSWKAFRQGLRELGYIEGQNIVLNYRWSEGQLQRFPALAAELVSLKVDVIVTSGNVATMALKRATTTIPVVMAASGDPVGAGLVASLRHPGGNVTGLTLIASNDAQAKRLELLKEAVPRAAVIAYLFDPANTSADQIGRDEMESAARTLGVALRFAEFKSADDLEDTFGVMSKAHAAALLVSPGPSVYRLRHRIIDLAAKHHLPAMYGYREAVEDGGLMAWGTNNANLFRRAATYVDKILKGAKPADLPVEQPTKFELVINLKTAKALGLTIPQSLLQRADEVIQ